MAWVVAGELMQARSALYLEFSRPFTLVAPALGISVRRRYRDRRRAARGVVGDLLIVYPLIGALMAAVLNAASNALNQIYDLEIDRVNKPKRPLPSGRIVDGRRVGVHVGRPTRSRGCWRGSSRPAAGTSASGSSSLATIITILYSVPPFRTKRLGIWANVTIAIPRGVLLKVAGWSSVKTVVGVEPWYIGAIFGLFLLGAIDDQGLRRHGGRRARRLPDAADPVRRARARRG